MRLLLKYGADPDDCAPRRCRNATRKADPDPSGPDRSGIAAGAVRAARRVAPIHAASGVGYGLGFAGNTHRHVPDGWVPAVKFLVEELGADVNARDHNGYTPLHHAAARGDNDLIQYLVSKGADVKAVARSGQTTVGHGERAGAAHRAVPGDDRAAREPRREEQPPLRGVLRVGWSRGPGRPGRSDMVVSSSIDGAGDMSPNHVAVRPT